MMTIDELKVEMENAKAEQETLSNRVYSDIAKVVLDAAGGDFGGKVSVEVLNEGFIAVNLPTQDDWHHPHFNVTVSEKRDEHYNRLNEYTVTISPSDMPKCFVYGSENAMLIGKVFANLMGGFDKIVEYVNCDDYKKFIPLKAKYSAAKYDYEKEVEDEKFKNFVDSLNGAKIKTGFAEYNIVKVMANTMDIDRLYAKRIKLTDAFAKVNAGTWKIVK